jgi:ABC-type dipeptide/oligopeptide/nickel transport system permease subunit
MAADASTPALSLPVRQQRTRPGARWLRAGLPGLWLCIVVFFAVFANALPMPGPADMDFAAAEQGPSATHWLGTDADGRDILSRVAYGGRVSMVVSLAAPLIGLFFGTLLGLLAAYYSGIARALILGGMDVVLAFPGLVFALGLTVVLGPSVQSVTLALGVMSIPAFARIARANALPLLSREFVLAARTAGAGDAYIMFREVLPNMAMALLTYALTMMSVMIVAEGALSFLGVGVQPPTPSWGGMMAEGRESLERVPQACLAPAAVMFLTVLSLNLLGDRLRRSRGRKASTS